MRKITENRTKKKKAMGQAQRNNVIISKLNNNSKNIFKKLLDTLQLPFILVVLGSHIL